MNDQNDELELQALQRELDDAFATTRPRRNYEDELWLALQQLRPASSRLAGFLGVFRNVPMVPAAAVAATLVVVIGVGLLAYSGVGRGPSGASTAMSNGAGQSRIPADLAQGAFGKLPSPVFTPGKTTGGGVTAPTTANYAAAIQYVWAGTVTVGATTARVYRYREPSADVADQFASGLSAVLRDRPPGFLGSYSAATYTLKVRGTVQSPPSSPAFFIFSSLSMPPIEAAGASQADLATMFLAAHRLIPDWPYAVSVDSSGDPVKVRYARQFDVPGYGPSYLVDANGDPYGLEVDLSANRPVLASGLLPLSLDGADYNIVSPSQAVMPALAPPSVAGPTPPPTAILTRAELVYVLVPAGDHSFYEPAYLYTGTFQVKGQTYTAHLLMPAVDPSQRTQ
ncbi:MAG TPA: hypothetical protein VJR46_04775 [Candidatus Dormibacteraeota bacterium]|nr:hypothetical protein [Candidatus Dormibacteraeota bacterium]